MAVDKEDIAYRESTHIYIVILSVPCPYTKCNLPFLNISLILFETYANVSSQICPFLALRPEFHSNHCVNSSTPKYCQSATFGRLTFCVYTLLFYGIRV